MSKNFKLIVCILIATGIFSYTAIAEAYRVEIQRVSNDKTSCLMKAQEEAEFTVKAYTGEEPGGVEDSEIAIQKVSWYFDYTMFEKTASGAQTIKLKALKEGKSTLKAMLVVDNSPFTAEAEITVEK